MTPLTVVSYNIHRGVGLDRRRDVFGRLETVFRVGTGVLEPSDVEIVAAIGDLLPGEAAETACFALILPLRSSQRIFSESFR